MELRLPDATQKFDHQDQAQLRRAIEAFARKPLAMVTETAGTVRIDGGAVPLDIRGPEGQYAQFSRGQLSLGAQDDDLEGGELTLVGGPNAAGADYPSWHLDNYAGVLRLYSGATSYFQVGTAVVQVVGVPLEVNATGPGLRWYESDQGVDQKYWDIAVDGTIMFFRCVNDAYSVGNVWMQVTRGAGAAVGTVRFNTNVDFLTNNAFDIGTGGNWPRNIGYGSLLTHQGTQVLSARITGWGLPTGTLTRTTFDTATVTLPLLAQRVAALIKDCRDHGFIGA